MQTYNNTQGDPKKDGDEKKPPMPGQPGGDDKKEEKGFNTPRTDGGFSNKRV